MKSKKVVQKSKTKIKKQRRKEQYISLKKIQNEQRQNIIKSLEQHKKNTAQLINNLPFEEAKYLGQKRKTQSKEKKSIDKEKEEIIEKSIEENNELNGINNELKNLCSLQEEQIELNQIELENCLIQNSKQIEKAFSYIEPLKELNKKESFL